MDAVTRVPLDHRRARFGMGTLSVRARLTLITTIVAAVGMLLVGLVVYSTERHRITEAVETRLIAQLETARRIVGQPPEEGWANVKEALAAVMQIVIPGETSGAAGIVDGAVALVPGVGQGVDLSEEDEFIDFIVTETATQDVVTGMYKSGSMTLMYLAAPVSIEADRDSGAVFVRAYDLDLELAGLELSARAYMGTALGVLAVIAAVAWLSSTYLLRPVRQMRVMAERVSALSLDERLPVRGRDDVSELASTMNSMLDRLDDAIAVQRQLLGDVGHELKTPLTIVHGYLDVMDARDPLDVEDTRRLALDEIERMGRLVGDLVDVEVLLDDQGLRKARIGAGRLLRTIAQKAEMLAPISLGEIADVDAHLDAAKITQAVLQLVQNATTHGGGEIELSSHLAGGSLDIVVRDHGPGIPEADKVRIFGRFERLAQGGRGVDGSGLGLHIVQLIAHQHGGHVVVTDPPGGGAAFVMSLPLARGAVEDTLDGPVDPSGGE